MRWWAFPFIHLYLSLLSTMGSIMSKPKIAIIGRGHVANAIQQGAERAGYEVRTTGHDAKDVSLAASWGDVLILAVPGPARRATVQELGDVRGKVLVDPTNLLSPDYSSYTGDPSKSGAEELQEWAAGARVVKAFNTVFAVHMSTGKIQGEPISLFVAADDPEAKAQVLRLGKDIGFHAVDAGPLRNARMLEPLGVLNIQLSRGPSHYGPGIGFRLIGAPSK